jgi:hypothetical protein
MEAPDDLNHCIERDIQRIAAKDDRAGCAGPKKSLYDIPTPCKSRGVVQLDDEAVVPSGLHDAQAANVGPVDSAD